MRFSFPLIGLLFTIAMESLAAVEPAPVAPTNMATDVRLRGLGELHSEQHSGPAERDGGSWISITADSAEQVGWCASKFLADATAMGPVRVVEGTGLAGTVVALDHGGWWLLGVEGKRFQVLFAFTREALSARVKELHLSAWRPIVAHSHPAWLDCFDNAAVGFWVLGGGVLPQDLEADMKWFAEKHFTMCATGVDEGRLVAPGVLDTTVLDWYSAKAKQYGVPYRMLLGWASATRPAWVRNITPLPHIPLADGPSVIAPVFDRQNMTTEVAFEPVEATDPWVMDTRRRIAERAAADPWFIGHHVSPELSGSGTLSLDRVAGLPETQRAWQAYLRDELHLDLQAVSLRHTGRADAYRTWNDVTLPMTKDFSGWDAPTSISLRGIWEGHADREKAGTAGKWFDPVNAPQGWVPVDCNDAMLLLYARSWEPDNNPSYWLRRSVEISAEQANKPQFLHISRSWWHGAHTSMKVWVNGKPLIDLSSQNPVAGDSDLSFAVGEALVVGTNRIVLDTRGSPVPSYIFLSPTGREGFPNRSEPLNRRYFDAVNFAPRLRAAGLENAMAATRAGDPYRPMKVMAVNENYDGMVDLFNRYGAYPRDTGQSGACWAPWTTSAIQARGGQHSSEPGNPAFTADELRNFFAFYLMLADDAVDIVFHNDLYRTKPELNAWIDGHRQLMKCVGKMERILPTVAVLRSNRTTRLGIDTPYNVDLTRGELQACGRTGQLVDLPDVAAGVTDAFPVLFDAGTEVMTEDDVSAIERYVRGGGIFIAQHLTGRHAPEGADSWPLSRLTGVTATNRGEGIGGPLQFSQTQTLWPQFRGKQVRGWGLALDWQGVDVTGPAVDLTPGTADVEAIAEWVQTQPGQGKVAIAARHLGKGTIITLGSTFWREVKDAGGVYRPGSGAQEVLDELLTSLGVTRDSWTGQRDV